MCKYVSQLAALLCLAAGTAQAIQAPVAVPNGDFEDYASIGDGVTNAGWASFPGSANGMIADAIPANDEFWSNPSSFGSGWQSNGPQAGNGKFGLQHPRLSNQNDMSTPFSGDFIGFMNLTEGDGEGASVGQVQSVVVGTLEEGSYRLAVAVGARPSGSWNDTWYQISLVADPVAGPNDTGSSDGTVLGTPASMTLVPSTAVLGSNSEDLVYTLDVGPDNPYLGAPIAVRIDVANAGTQDGAETTLSTFTQANFDNVRLCIERAPNIVFVSFHAGDDVPSDNAAAAGFTEAPDKGYTDLLEAQGYNVTRYITTGTPDVNVINAADLAIISRSVNSGNYSNDAATTWNSVTSPMIITGGYPLRNSRMGYTTGGTMVDTTGDVTLTVTNPGHPIFAGVELDANDVMVNPFAGVVVYPTDGTTLARGTSINTDEVNAEGTVLATISAASAANGPAGGMVIGEWQAGAMLTHSGGAGTDALAGHRLVFLTGSREASGISSETAGIIDLLPDGEQMFLNAVNYMLACYPCAPTTTDLLARYEFDDGTANDSSGNGNHGTLAGTAAIADVIGGGVLSLDGSGKVDLGDPNSMKIEGEITVAAWVQILGGSSNRNIVNKGHDDSGLPTGYRREFTMRVDSADPANYDFGTWESGRSPGDQNASAPVPQEDFEGNWVHLAGTAVYDAASDTYTWNLYRNGVLQNSSVPYATGMHLVNFGWAIGARGGVDNVQRGFVGYIDDVHIYGAALSGSEICYLASQTPGDFPEMEIPNLLENGSFEEPGAAQVGFDGVSGWMTDMPAVNSGVRMDGATDGDFVAYLGGGDPGLQQVTGHAVEVDDTLVLSVDAMGTAGAMLQMRVLVDAGVILPVATSDPIAVGDVMQTYVLEVPGLAAFAGSPVSVELSNVGEAGSEVVVDKALLVE